MASRTPLVIGSDGLPQQLQASDSIPAALGYTSGSNTNGKWVKRPDGVIEQTGSVTLSSGAATITFPIAFATVCDIVLLTPVSASASADLSAYLGAAPGLTTASVRGTVTTVGIGAAVTAGTFTVLWRATGT